jgi:deoxyribonuclease-4
MYRVGAHVSTAGGLELAFDHCKTIGADVCQVFTRNQRQWNPHPLSEEQIANFLQTWQDSPVTSVSSHGSYLINLATPKEDLAQKSITALADELLRADQLQLNSFVFHPGAHTGIGVAEGIKRIATRLTQVLDAVEPKTIPLLETTAGQGSCIGSTFEELAQIIELLPKRWQSHVGICLDTCHVYSAGYDISEPGSFSEVLLEFDKLLGLERLQLLHLNDSKTPFNSHKDRHEHIGQGEIGSEAFRFIMNHPYLSTISKILETEKGENLEGDIMNITLLKNLVSSE